MIIDTDEINIMLELERLKGIDDYVTTDKPVLFSTTKLSNAELHTTISEFSAECGTD